MNRRWFFTLHIIMLGFIAGLTSQAVHAQQPQTLSEYQFKWLRWGFEADTNLYTPKVDDALLEGHRLFFYTASKPFQLLIEGGVRKEADGEEVTVKPLLKSQRNAKPAVVDSFRQAIDEKKTVIIAMVLEPHCKGYPVISGQRLEEVAAGDGTKSYHAFIDFRTEYLDEKKAPAPRPVARPYRLFYFTKVMKTSGKEQDPSVVLAKISQWTFTYWLNPQNEEAPHSSDEVVIADAAFKVGTGEAIHSTSHTITQRELDRMESPLARDGMVYARHRAKKD